jgi:4-amino-4-deoxy-L-arabinose transferase-like glycosyltransferase
MGDRRFWLRLLLIALLALTVRVAYIGIAKWSDDVEYSDALYYATQAQVLAEGGGFEHRSYDRPAADHAPLTQISQAPTALVFGRSVLAQRLVQAVYGTLAVVAVGLLARRVAGDRAGLWAAGIAAVYPNLWVNDGVILAETMTALLVALLLWAVYAYVDRPSTRLALLVGALSGLAALTRAELALLGILAFVPVAYRAWPSWSRRAGAVGLAALAGAVVLAPWMVYNAGRFEKPVVISTNDGLTLIGAYCDEQFDGPDPGLWDIACLPPGAFDDATQRRDQSLVNADYRHLAHEYAMDNLGDLPRVAAVRVARTWSLYDPASMVRYNRNEGREPPVGWAGFVSWWLLVPVAVAGAVGLYQRGRTIWPLLAPFVVVTLISAVFYGLLRFRVPAEVSLVVLAGAALAQLQGRRTVPAA